METISLQTVIGVLSQFGWGGIITLIWWYDAKRLREQQARHKDDVTKIFAKYEHDMDELRRMYEANVELVRKYENVAGDLKDVVMMNTQAITRLVDYIQRG